jgi:hypothetical protein
MNKRSLGPCVVGVLFFTLWPIYPPIQWVLGPLLPGNKSGRSVKAITRPSLVPKMRMHGCPLRVCVFFSTGIIFQFSFACFNSIRAEVGLPRGGRAGRISLY